MKIYKYILLLITATLTSCIEKPKTIDADRYDWNAGFSAPKYYPVGGAKVSFGNAGCSSLTNFDNGWGDSYGTFSDAERFKKLPRTLTVDYASAVENLVYQGTVQLPYEKIEKLFKKHIKNKETGKGYLIVGLAPGGWIRVWAYFSITGGGVIHNIEIMKAQVKGHKDPTIGEDFTNKKSEYWTKYKYYWNHFGIPLEAWATTEKEYNLFFNFEAPNPDNGVSYQYSSLDGTLGPRGKTTDLLKQKLPADLVIAWSIEKNNSLIGYDTHILMPKNFSKIVESKKTDNLEILLEIEKNQEYGILYLVTNNRKEKILKFKNIVDAGETGLGYSDFTKDITYYMQ